MSPSDAFDYVLEKYKISNQQVCEMSGVSKSVVSKFRNGKSDISSTNLQKILKSLPAKVTQHFNMLYLIDEPQINNNLKVSEKKTSYKV